jgi:hypothetical protein
MFSKPADNSKKPRINPIKKFVVDACVGVRGLFGVCENLPTFL